MKGHYLLLILLLVAISGYSQDQHNGCGHDDIPEQYRYDYSNFDYEAYNKFMDQTSADDLPEDHVADRTTPISVTFKNSGTVAVDRYWSSNGKLINYGVVEAGASIQRNTYVGHKWVFKDRDLTVGTYIANSENPSYTMSGMDDGCFEVPVNLVVLYKSDGTGRYSRDEVNEKFEEMNEICARSNWRLRFKITRFEQVISDDFYQMPDDRNKVTEIRDQYTNYPKAIPLILVRNSGPAAGYGNLDWLSMAKSPNVNHMLHEIGHFFGLQHDNSQKGEGKELVDGSNCRVAGDLICDTPASPPTVDYLKDGCTYIGTATDPNGQVYNPDVQNLMSIFGGCDATRATLEQERRMLFFLRNNYTEMNPCTAAPLTSNCDSELLPGAAVGIGSGGGKTFVIGPNGQIFRWDDGDWTVLPSEFEGYRLDVTGAGIPWVVSTDNKIYYYANNSWTQTNGGALDVGCSGNSVYVVGRNNSIYERVNNNWRILPSVNAKRIDVAGNGRPWVIGLNDKVYEFIDNTWVKRGRFDTKDLSIAEGGEELWVLDTEGVIHEYLGSNVFVPNGTSADNEQISVASDNTVWVVNKNKQILKSTCQDFPEDHEALNISQGTYSIMAKHSDKALDVYGISNNNGANIVQWSYVGGDNQKWNLEHLGDNVYTIKSKLSNKVLGVLGRSNSNGANIIQWSYVGRDNQKWKIQPVGDGYYRVIAVHSGKALSVNDSQTTNGTNVNQREYEGIASQKWRFDRLDQVGSRSRDRLKDLSGRTTLDQKVELNWYYHLPTQVNEVSSYTLQHYDEALEEFVDVETLTADSFDDPNSVQTTFTHNRPAVGANYYKVRVEFANGEYDYSEYETIVLSESTMPITIAPNPANNELRLDLSNFRTVGVQYLIMDMQGKEWSKGYYNEGHTDLEVIDLSAYRNGNYFIYLKPENRRGFSQQFIVMKEY